MMVRAPGDGMMSSSSSSQLVWMEVIDKKGRAIGFCTLMAFGFVAVLYAPVLCLPRPKSAQVHMLRRITCAAVASSMAPFICVKILSVHLELELDRAALLKMLGVSTTHLWQAAVIPTLLTSIVYLGPLLVDLLDFIVWCADDIKMSGQWNLLMPHLWVASVNHAKMLASDVLWWRNFLAAPISEELVFRVCMVPVLLCGGFTPSAVVFICPMFFALAHIHHFWELVYGQRQEISTATLIVGMQLGYTTVFGWYATFLYLRTGHLIAPLVAHMFCNTMGLPDIGGALSSPHQRGVILAYLVGFIGFFALLGPMSDPALYNSIPITKDCSCWLGYCKWRVPEMPYKPDAN